MPHVVANVLGLAEVAEIWHQAGVEMRPVMSRALNHTGGVANTQVNRQLAKQMGLPYGEVRARVKQRKASPENLVFEIKGEGRPLSLRLFSPRQQRAGVAANPWGKRRVFPGTFLAKSTSGGMEVFKRAGKSRLPIEKLWGPSIPREMVESAVTYAFMATVRERFPNRWAREMQRAFRKQARLR